MNESKPSVPTNSPRKQKKGFHAVVLAKWNTSPERNKLSELWERHGLTICMVVLTVALLIYTITAIGISGFDRSKWLFAITMFLWFCLTYMFIRDNCGAEIYRVVLEPTIKALNHMWWWLKWYVLNLGLIVGRLSCTV